MSKRLVQMIGSGAAMEELRRLVAIMARSNSTVLVTGESGTGKELVARSLHIQGPRCDGQFVPVNCGAIPKELIESELFGHKRGAFTGALQDRKGRVELAHGGTLFLDEIGDLQLEMQVKLLRVLQERCVEPIGTAKAVPVDVRVIAATHKDLALEVAEGRFREDLYYRLNVLPLHVPSLRERKEDISVLIEHFSQLHASKDVRPISFKKCFDEVLHRYSWPGNIRELSNLIERFTTLLPGDQLTLKDMPIWLLPPQMAEIKDALLLDRAPTVGKPSLAGQLEEFVALLPEIEECLSPKISTSTGKTSTAGLKANAVSEKALETEDEDELLILLEGMDQQENVSGSKRSAAMMQEASCSRCEHCLQGMENISLKQRINTIETCLIRNALDSHQWNVSKAARMLGVQRTTLIEKINKLAIEKDSVAVEGVRA